MRWFQHIFEELHCPKCDSHRTIATPTLSPFYLVLATTATIPLFLASFRAPWHLSWYHSLVILAGEIFVLILSGLCYSIVKAFAAVANMRDVRCRCGSEMQSVGRHYRLDGTPRPILTDYIIIAFFVLINVIIWLYVIHLTITQAGPLSR